MGLCLGNAVGAVTLDNAAAEVATVVDALAVDEDVRPLEGRKTSMLRLEPPMRLIASIIVLNSQSGPVSRILLTEIISE